MRLSDSGIEGRIEYRIQEEQIEHREVYSMGHGNYLKHGHSDSSGWSVESEPLDYLNRRPLEDGLPVAPPTTSTTPNKAYEIQKHHHTKRGFDFWLIVLAAKVDRAEFERLRASCETAGGWYSRQWGRTPGGFAFKSQHTAEEWASSALDGQPAEPKAAPPRESWGVCERCKAAQGYAVGYAARMLCLCDDCRGPALTCLSASFGGSMFPMPTRESKPTTAPTYDAQQKARRFRDLADAMQKDVDHALRHMTQNPTPKRLREYASRKLDGANLERGQKALRALADAWDAGTVPAILQSLRTKTEILPLVRHASESSGYYDCHDSGKYADTSPVAVALQELTDGAATAEQRADQAERERRDTIERMEHALHGCDIPGFFPTPPALIQRMLAAADIREGQLILEPSAGKGDIADAIRARHGATVAVTCVERSYKLREILAAKGHDLAKHDDIMECDAHDFYDAAIMNPPFERGSDADHVRKVYDMLKPGGRLVAIVSGGTLQRSDRKATDFQNWLSDLDAYTETIDAGSFTGPEAFRQTGVASALVVIDKPPTPAQLAEAPRAKLNPEVSTTAERATGILRMANMLLF